ncbi:MAG: SpoIID/LytB domain-containing protein [Candidatus Obscuribacter sp.]|nr:SpoIID/LytB domain-containing protein [Candidatus Obscuribacter sp.]
MGSHRHLLILLLVVFSNFLSPPVLSLDARVRVQLFASAENAASKGSVAYTLSPPFRVVAPLPLSVLTGDDWRLVLDSASRQVRLLPSAIGTIDDRVRQAGLSGAELQLLPLGKPLSLHAGTGGAAKKTRLINARVFLRYAGGGLKVIAELPTADYVAGVVGSESPPQFHLEALKAQSVLVQNWLSCRDSRKDIADDTSTMAYLGADYARTKCREAVQATLATQLRESASRRLLKPYFHSTCAGRLSTSQLFQGKPGPSARPAACNTCQASPFFLEHLEKLSAAEVERKLSLELLQVNERDAAGRPLLVSVRQHSRVKKMSGYNLWLLIGQKLGWGVVPGLAFSFEKQGGTYLFRSRGAGHGIGYCQWGGHGLAEKGKNYVEILRFYFPDAVPSK